VNGEFTQREKDPQIHHRARAAGDRQRRAPGPQDAAQKSNATLRELGPDIQGVESYVAADKTFCVYLAKDEAIIREHARRSAFPANRITEVRRRIDPTTATEA
jgi:Nickel responsive protein SCO4226-like